MMRVLICTLNARYTHLSPAIRYLRNALRDADASLELGLREYLINQKHLEIVQDIAAWRPDAVLFSVYIWNAEHFAYLVADLRRLLPDCRLIAGGPELSWQPEAWLRRLPQLDLVVSGPGEPAMAELVASGWSLDAWPDRILDSPVADFHSIDQPYTDEDYPDFASRYLYYESSRGCPFACAYCLSSHASHRLQAKPVDRVEAELELLLRQGPGLMKFVDRTFNADPARARRLWSWLIDRARAGEGQGGRPREAACRFHFEVHPGLLGDEDFRLLAEAPTGLFQFELGVQTIHAATRRRIDRPGDWEREAMAIRRLTGLGSIHCHVDLIAGLPGEGIEDIAASLDQLATLGADHIQLGFLKLLPGTSLHRRAEDYGLVASSRPPYEVLRTGSLSVEDLRLLKAVAELVENIYNTHRYDRQLGLAVQATGGSFAAYRSFLDYCQMTGFDIRTRNREKLGPCIDGWLEQLPARLPD